MNIRDIIIKELHKPVRKNFPRRCTVLKGLNDLYQADLVEVIPYANINKGFKYILTVIDCFSKLAHCVPLRSKSAEEVTNAMEQVLRSCKMKHLQTDDGKEYYNKSFSNLMKKYNINHYSTRSEKKATIIERFNKTLKSEMYKNFSSRGSYKWYDILPKMVTEYNRKYHRTIGMSPIEVDKSNEKIVLARIKKLTYPKEDKRRAKGVNLGDRVRISKFKKIFAKGYLPNWTNEVFTVHRVQPTNPTTYILKDHKGEIIEGGFYGHEISKSKVGDVYLVEKILKKKGNKVLVRWVGFDQKEDSWVDKKDLV